VPRNSAMTNDSGRAGRARSVSSAAPSPTPAKTPTYKSPLRAHR
jgi:hypothetical protein